MRNTMCAVTGAYGYSGKYIAARLLNENADVICLTNSPQRPHPFGDRVKAFPLSFDNLDLLKQTLRGVDVLYNTYWVRFNHRSFTHAQAIQNTCTLFEAARQAGVRRIVHVSITNPSLESPLEYFSGKARLEQALQNSDVSYAILRPAVIFGREDILVNNIAWALRHFPFFAVFGDGTYRLQPIYVEDLAELAVSAGKSTENTIINAIGPETFTYRDLITTIAAAIGIKPRLIQVSPGLGYFLSRIIGLMVRDKFLTREEIKGLMDDLLYTDSPPTGKTRLTQWIKDNSETLGREYASELQRRRDRFALYVGRD